jgi:hypothetical protein
MEICKQVEAMVGVMALNAYTPQKRLLSKYLLHRLGKKDKQSFIQCVNHGVDLFDLVVNVIAIVRLVLGVGIGYETAIEFEKGK